MPGFFVESDNTKASPEMTTNPVVKSGPLSIDRATRAVVVSGYPLYLTNKEFAVLEILMLRKGATITKRMIMDHLYGGGGGPELGIVQVFVCKLRKKLSALSGGETFIDTIWGGGYMMRDIVGVQDQAAMHKTAA